MGRPGLTQHRKFRRLASALKSEPLARGVLELLWDACYENGDDYLGTAQDVENLARWKKKSALVDALVNAGAPDGHGFIEIVSGTNPTLYKIHDLWHHAPDYVRKRRERELKRTQRFDPAFPSTDRRDEPREPADSDRQTAPDGGQWIGIPNSQIGVDRTPAPAPAPAPLSTKTKAGSIARAREVPPPAEPQRRGRRNRDQPPEPASWDLWLKMAFEVLDAEPDADYATWTAELKDRASERGIAYDTDVVARAIDRAVHVRVTQPAQKGSVQSIVEDLRSATSPEEMGQKLRNLAGRAR